MTNLIRLDIGSGTAPKPGYLTVDPYVDGVDYTDSMWNLKSFANESVDEIHSSHALEHIPQKMVIPTLREWRRVLKSDGKICIAVPDLEWCVNRWLQTQGTGWDMAIIFGNQNHDGEYHKTGFTVAILTHYLFTAGFFPTVCSKIFTHEQQTLYFEAIKRGAS